MFMRLSNPAYTSCKRAQQQNFWVWNFKHLKVSESSGVFINWFWKKHYLMRSSEKPVVFTDQLKWFLLDLSLTSHTFFPILQIFGSLIRIRVLVPVNSFKATKSLCSSMVSLVPRIVPKTPQFVYHLKIQIMKFPKPCKLFSYDSFIIF